LALDALNRYVLIAIGVFAGLLYVCLFYAGFTEFLSRIEKAGKRRANSRKRRVVAGLRNEKSDD
jgi:hypothetical protein